MASRSRFVDYAPIPDSPPLFLHQRDIELFALLQEFPYLPLPYIGELLGYDRKTYLQDGRPVVRYPSLRQRLARLRKDGGYLKCPAESWQAANARYKPAVYALTQKAKDELKRRGLYRPSIKLGNDFAHDFGSCLVPASFKLGVQANPRLRYIDAREIMAHPKCPEETKDAPEPFVIPITYFHRNIRIETHKEHDWQPFGVAYQLEDGKERKILFPGHEFDRDSEGNESPNPKRSSLERHLRIILALLDHGYEKHFGTGRFFVPFITIGEPRMRSAIRTVLKLTDGKGSKHILFKYVDDFASFASFPPATGHMLTVPWERAGHEADVLFFLNEAPLDFSRPKAKKDGTEF